jgi:biotin transport system substrate-specific component
LQNIAIMPRTRISTVTVVVAFAGLTAILAQVRIPLWFTPVPITGQTFAVLLAGTLLTWRHATASQALYVLAGLVGLPVFQGAQGGWAYATGPTFGYLVGFVAAAATVGLLLRHTQVDTLGAVVAGTLVIYLFGVGWLAATLHVGFVEAAGIGMVPFLAGDAAKAVLAALPASLASRGT